VGIKRRIGHLACVSDNLNGMGSGRETIYILGQGVGKADQSKDDRITFRNTPIVIITDDQKYSDRRKVLAEISAGSRNHQKPRITNAVTTTTNLNRDPISL
jgi:hypothetical protein